MQSSITGVLPVSAADHTTRIHEGNTFVMYCPTFQEKWLSNASNNYTRSSVYTYYKGTQERCFITTKTPLFWRRIVFWTHTRFSEAVPWRISGESHETYYLRRTDEYAPTDTDFTRMINEVFAGTDGIDRNMSTIWNQQLAKQRIKVVFDRTHHIPANSSAPTVTQGDKYFRKYWHRGGKMQYGDTEEGMELAGASGEGFSDYGRNLGNQYILDIFSTGQTEGSEQVGSFGVTTTRYWHER